MFASIFLIYFQLISAAAFLLNYSMLSVNYLVISSFEVAGYFGAGAILSFVWLITCLRRIKKGHFHMVEEVAIFLYPLGFVLSLIISGLLSYFTFEYDLANDKTFVISAICGLTIAAVILVKSLDIRFMRSLDELTDEYDM